MACPSLLGGKGAQWFPGAHQVQTLLPRVNPKELYGLFCSIFKSQSPGKLELWEVGREVPAGPGEITGCVSLPGFTFLFRESREAAPCPPLCEVCPCSMRTPVACPQPCGVCPQGMQDAPAVCPQPRRALQVAAAQASAGAGLWIELSGMGTAEVYEKAAGAGPGKLAGRCSGDKRTDTPASPGIRERCSSSLSTTTQRCRGLPGRHSVPVHALAPGWTARSR